MSRNEIVMIVCLGFRDYAFAYQFKHNKQLSADGLTQRVVSCVGSDVSADLRKQTCNTSTAKVKNTCTFQYTHFVD